MDKLLHIAILSLFCLSAYPQFPPPAGQEGTTAIHKDSTVFIDWAIDAEVVRGYYDISLPDSGFVSFGDEDNATGYSDNLIISLGDGGSATLTFNIPIADGPGPDFAVFENSFTDDFLELAFVEVSSDGINYFRFESISYTQTNTQVGSFGSLDPTKIHNLAGKYRVEYGTPFDLEELGNIPGLNTDSITHIKVIDVIGCILDEFTTFDSEGNKVNDPWPTSFLSGGFDLDAVGVIHDVINQDIFENSKTCFKIYPNPVLSSFRFESCEKIFVRLINANGHVLFESEMDKGLINMEKFPKGVYFLQITNYEKNLVRKILKQ